MCKAVGSKFVVAQALMIFKWYGAVAFTVLLLFVLGDYWLLQSMLGKDYYVPVVIKIVAQLLYDNNLRISSYIFWSLNGC